MMFAVAFLAVDRKHTGVTRLNSFALFEGRKKVIAKRRMLNMMVEDTDIQELVSGDRGKQSTCWPETLQIIITPLCHSVICW